MDTNPVNGLLGQGVLGVVCAILFYWVWKREADLAGERKTLSDERKEWATERVRLVTDYADKVQKLNDRYQTDMRAELSARVSDAGNYTTLALNLQKETTATANRLTDVFEEMKMIMGAPQYRGSVVPDEREREAIRNRPTIGPVQPTPARGGRYSGGGGE